jgi:hypothetical protein
VAKAVTTTRPSMNCRLSSRSICELSTHTSVRPII